MIDSIERYLRENLPNVDSSAQLEAVIFYVRLYDDDAGWNCFLADGCESDGEYLVRGLLVRSLDVWLLMPAQTLLSQAKREGALVCIDRGFKPLPYSMCRFSWRSP